MRKLEKMISAIEIILRHVHEGIVIADREGRVVYVNDANERITGFDNSKILGRLVKEVVPESSLIEVIKTGREKLGTRTRVRDKYVISNIVPIYDESEIIGSISVFLDVTEVENLNLKLKKAQEQIDKLSRELSTFTGDGNFICGKSEIMKKIMYIAQKAAGVNSNVLITGESGTGKEVLAHYIHKLGSRKEKPFVAINCGAIPETLLESELFGYEPGAFTGAGNRGKAGIFELANGGTIFLDEVGDMPLALQVKLLRVLQDKEIQRLGGTTGIKLDVRVMAATNKPLEKMINEKSFREDLYYRLNVIEISLPPLRERKEDIPSYVRFLLDKLAVQLKIPCPGISPGAMKTLMNYDFPGNIRELENILEKSMVMDEDGTIDNDDLPGFLNADAGAGRFYIDTEGKWPKLKDVEKTLLEKTIAAFGNKTRAAKALGISRATLYRMLEELKRDNVSK
ncbi:MAG: sigma 54-interacting transcriptional regulator [Tepidanaerobacteraceae bacterium]|nr:sigma 54-interacting transcriptional regulator [Tepidanaerobacteraceae bacterium]